MNPEGLHARMATISTLHRQTGLYNKSRHLGQATLICDQLAYRQDDMETILSSCLCSPGALPALRGRRHPQPERKVTKGRKPHATALYEGSQGSLVLSGPSAALLTTQSTPKLQPSCSPEGPERWSAVSLPCSTARSSHGQTSCTAGWVSLFLFFFLPGLGVTNDPQALGPPDHLCCV